MATIQEWLAGVVRRHRTRAVVQVLAGAALCAVTVGSAILVKELRGHVVPLAAVDVVSIDQTAAAAANNHSIILASTEPPAIGSEDEEPVDEVVTGDALDEETAAAPEGLPADLAKYASDPEIRWFDGRPVRPARKMWMVVTGYSPDARSCGDSADGLTATLHSVNTNNMKLVAADTRVLPYGSMLTVPGYGDNKIVPVLDCGGAIKGRRLDLLFPTHEQARKWGKKRVLVTVWEYADGKPAVNPRKLR